MTTDQRFFGYDDNGIQKIGFQDGKSRIAFCVEGVF